MPEGGPRPEKYQLSGGVQAEKVWYTSMEVQRCLRCLIQDIFTLEFTIAHLEPQHSLAAYRHGVDRVSYRSSVGAADWLIDVCPHCGGRRPV